MPISAWVSSAREGLHVSTHDRNSWYGGRHTAAFTTTTKNAISIAPSSFSLFTLKGPPGKFKRPCLNRSLRSERSVHHSEWILSVLLPEDRGATAKQNKTAKKNKKYTAWTHNCLPFPNLIYHPAPLPTMKPSMPDQFVSSLSIASPDFSATLSLFN